MPDKLLGRIGDFLQGRTSLVQASQDCLRCRDWSRFGTSSGVRIFTTPRSRRSKRRTVPANLDPALREERTVDGTYNDLQLPRHGQLRPSIRAQRAARTHVSRHAEPDDAEPAPRQPRAHDPRTSFSPRRSSTCSPRPGSSSWCTTGSCTNAARPSSSRFRSSPATTGPTRRCAAAHASRSRPPPDPRARRPTPTRTVTGGMVHRSTDPTRSSRRSCAPARAAS